MSEEETRAKRVKWLRALWSGRYRQGLRRLVNREGGRFTFCCLGVAEVEVFGTPHESIVDANYMPQSHAERLGMTYSDQVEYGKWNDSGKSFRTIAELLAERWDIAPEEYR